MYKFILSLFIIILFILISISIPSTDYIVRAVYTVPELNNITIEKKLINEFSNIKGIIYHKTSIESMSILLDYDEYYINNKDIKNILQKWGCTITSVYYQNILTYD